MTGRISVRLAAPSAPRSWLRHDFRDQVPSYASQEAPAGGRVVLVHGGRPDLAAERALAEQRRRKAGIRSGRPPAVIRGAIVTLSREAVADIQSGRVPLGDADRAVAEALRAEFGDDLLYVVRHADEVSPHWHAALRNIGSDGKARRLDREGCSKLQDRIGASIERAVGWRRGVPVRERRARGEGRRTTRHRSVRELHATLADDLAAAEDEAKKALENERKLRTLLELYERQREVDRDREGALVRDLEEMQRQLKLAVAERDRLRRVKLEADRAAWAVEAIRASAFRLSPSSQTVPFSPLPDSEHQALARVGAFERNGVIYSSRNDIRSAKVQLIAMVKMCGAGEFVASPPEWAAVVAQAAAEMKINVRIFDDQGVLKIPGSSSQQRETLPPVRPFQVPDRSR